MVVQTREATKSCGNRSRSVGKGVMGREEIRIQTISCSLLHPVVSANSI